MLKIRTPSQLRNQKGMAMIEAVPLIVIFVMLLSFGMGFYGAIHTATLHSISARTYAFETFRQRANLNYFREDESGLSAPMHYKKKGFRFHAVSNDLDLSAFFVSTVRPMSIGRNIASTDTNSSTHNQQVFELKRRNQDVGVDPIWVMVGYGICLDPRCGE